MLKQVFSLFILSLLFFSCQQEDTQKNAALSHIPASADVVMAFDVEQMMEKADFDAVTQMAFYEDFVKEIASENEAFAKIAKQPSKSGLDMDSKFFIGFERNGRDMEQVTLVFPMADQAKFEEMLENTDIEDEDVIKGASYYKNKNSVLTWNEEVALLVASPKDDFEVADAEKLLELDQATSISSNKNLQKCIKEDADMSIWIDSEVIIEDPEAVDQMTKLLGIDIEDLKGNYLHTFLNFENGQIKASTKYFIKSIVANDLDLFFKDAPDTDFTSLFPSENLNIFFSAALELKGINQILIEKHIQGSANDLSEEYGIAFEDLMEASNGDLAMGLYIDTKEENKKSPGLIFATMIEDQEKLNNILQQAEKKELIQKTSEGLYELLGVTNYIEYDSIQDTVNVDMDGFVLIKDDILYITSNEDLLEQLHAERINSNGAINKQLAKVTKENIFALVTMNENNITEDWPFGMITNEAIIQSNRKRSEFVLKTDNANENSLKTFFKEVNKEFEENQSSKESKI